MRNVIDQPRVAEDALTAFVVQLSTGGRRDFTSGPAIRAERYDVMVDEAHADRALELP